MSALPHVHALGPSAQKGDGADGEESKALPFVLKDDLEKCVNEDVARASTVFTGENGQKMSVSGLAAQQLRGQMGFVEVRLLEILDAPSTSLFVDLAVLQPERLAYSQRFRWLVGNVARTKSFSLNNIGVVNLRARGSPGLVLAVPAEGRSVLRVRLWDEKSSWMGGCSFLGGLYLHFQDGHLRGGLRRASTRPSDAMNNGEDGSLAANPRRSSAGPLRRGSQTPTLATSSMEDVCDGIPQEFCCLPLSSWKEVERIGTQPEPGAGVRMSMPGAAVALKGKGKMLKGKGPSRPSTDAPAKGAMAEGEAVSRRVSNMCDFLGGVDSSDDEGSVRSDGSAPPQLLQITDRNSRSSAVSSTGKIRNSSALAGGGMQEGKGNADAQTPTQLSNPLQTKQSSNNKEGGLSAIPENSANGNSRSSSSMSIGKDSWKISMPTASDPLGVCQGLTSLLSVECRQTKHLDSVDGNILDVDMFDDLLKKLHMSLMPGASTDGAYAEYCEAWDSLVYWRSAGGGPQRRQTRLFRMGGPGLCCISLQINPASKVPGRASDAGAERRILGERENMCMDPQAMPGGRFIIRDDGFENVIMYTKLLQLSVKKKYTNSGSRVLSAIAEGEASSASVMLVDMPQAGTEAPPRMEQGEDATPVSSEVHGAFTGGGMRQPASRLTPKNDSMQQDAGTREAGAAPAKAKASSSSGRGGMVVSRILNDTSPVQAGVSSFAILTRELDYESEAESGLSDPGSRDATKETKPVDEATAAYYEQEMNTVTRGTEGEEILTPHHGDGSHAKHSPVVVRGAQTEGETAPEEGEEAPVRQIVRQSLARHSARKSGRGSAPLTHMRGSGSAGND
ncbi:unnamed protein product, partial [Amoebophrya sp. A25]|eukprot:GSA25T00009748001.1